MPRKRIQDGDRLVDVAVGITGWLLAVEMMIMLEQRKVLRRKDTLRIIGGAIAALDSMADQTAPHAALEVARSILRGQAEGWSK